MKRRVLDVGDLPRVGFGARDPLWWSMVLLDVIEGSMMVLLAVAYVYVSQRTSPWPPELTGRWVAQLATVELGLLLASVPAIAAAGRAARRADLPAMRRWFIVGTALGLAAGGCRYLIFESLPFRWDAHAYGSVVWTMLGVQTFHLATSVAENGAMIVGLVRGPVAHRHRMDLDASTVLWYLVVAGAVLQYGLVFVDIWRTGGG